MKKTIGKLAVWIMVGFCLGWAGLPHLGASIVTLVVFLTPVMLLSVAEGSG